MKAVFDPRGGAWMEGKYVPSLLAAIGDVIEQHMIEIGFVPPKRRRDAPLEGEVVTLAIAAGPQSNPPSQAGEGASRGASRGAGFRQCPKCGEAALIRLEGCDQCTSCDYSKCG
jgi:ribonucleoside-diphosphate reductase alpha chain